jgi:glycyl-tRNA synthetase
MFCPKIYKEQTVLAMEKSSVDDLTNLAIRRAIIMPAFEIYGEIGGFYDYGPIGTRIRHNIITQWRGAFIEELGNLEIDSTIVAPEPVFEASGHLSSFSDPMAICDKCHTAYRADKLLEEYFESKGMHKEAAGLKKLKPDELEQMLKQYNIKCGKCGTALAKVSVFNLMLKTGIGPLEAVTGYLRPETAQGIFMDFKRIFSTHGLKLPIGIGQVGRVFRNEISPRKMLVRLREFSQMELEYFFDPNSDALSINGEQVGDSFLEHEISMLPKSEQEAGSSELKRMSLKQCLEKGYMPNKLFAFLIYKESVFLRSLGFPEQSIRFRQALDVELPHYSKGNIDVEALIGDTFEEIIGNAYRTDFDLANHQKHSGKDMSIINGEAKVLPHVVEASFGIDRIFWSIMYNSMYMDKERGWEVLKLDKRVAPYRCAVFPLQKDDKLVEKALQVSKLLVSNGIPSYYSQSNSIGKRYAKADEIGVPFAVTVDYQTLEDNTVTVRKRDDTKQVRSDIGGLDAVL